MRRICCSPFCDARQPEPRSAPKTDSMGKFGSSDVTSTVAICSRFIQGEACPASVLRLDPTILFRMVLFCLFCLEVGACGGLDFLRRTVRRQLANRNLAERGRWSPKRWPGDIDFAGSPNSPHSGSKQGVVTNWPPGRRILMSVREREKPGLTLPAFRRCKKALNYLARAPPSRTQTPIEIPSNHERRLPKVFESRCGCGRISHGIFVGSVYDSGLGRDGFVFSILRHLAVGDQHGNFDRHVLNRFFDPEHSEPRC
jgi:hypothetical protein